MKLMQVALMALTIFAAGSFNKAQAFNHQDCILGGGGEIPSPHSVNTKMELADGEHYFLQGEVVMMTANGVSEPYFKVDLEAMPWLANKERVRYPYYPLEGQSGDWNNFLNQVVRISVIAHGRVSVFPNNTASYIISLTPAN